MDELLLKIADKYGLSGVIVLFIIWDKFIHPYIKRATGKYVSWKEMNSKLDSLAVNYSELKSKMESRLEKAQEENIIIAKMQLEQDHFKENINELKENQKATFQILSEIKNMMIQNK